MNLSVVDSGVSAALAGAAGAAAEDTDAGADVEVSALVELSGAVKASPGEEADVAFLALPG